MITVYEKDGMFAGWPANHGHWQWGNEFLVGFLVGKYHVGGMHNVKGVLTKLLARSLDGGKTWSVETPNVDFEGKQPTSAPKFDIGRSIIRVCGGYDHGGDECDTRGAFYKSDDKGKTWDGPYLFTGLESEFGGKVLNTSRTCVVGDLIFLSARNSNEWGSDWVVVAKHDGERFSKVAKIADVGRVVMPSVVRTGSGYCMVARRKTKESGCFISAWVSKDGVEWEKTYLEFDTGARNGNPPALIEVNGRLFCAYGDRSERAIMVTQSRDDGVTWSEPKPIASAGLKDIGYPRLFKRTDGKKVCVFYWATKSNPYQRICAVEF